MNRTQREGFEFTVGALKALVLASVLAEAIPILLEIASSFYMDAKRYRCNHPETEERIGRYGQTCVECGEFIPDPEGENEHF